MFESEYNLTQQRIHTQARAHTYTHTHTNTTLSTKLRVLWLLNHAAVIQDNCFMGRQSKQGPYRNRSAYHATVQVMTTAKSSLYLIMHHIMKNYATVEVQLHTSITLILHGGEESDSHSNCCIRNERNPV